MKEKFLTCIMIGILVMGFWSLSTRPAKANILCLVNCINEYTSCAIDSRNFCRLFGLGLTCETAGIAACNILKNNCISNCGACPI